MAAGERSAVAGVRGGVLPAGRRHAGGARSRACGGGWRWRASGPGLAFVMAWVIPPTIGELERRATREAEPPPRPPRRRARAETRSVSAPAHAARPPPPPQHTTSRASRRAWCSASGSRVTRSSRRVAASWCCRCRCSPGTRWSSGASGSGKTETLLRIAHQVARVSRLGGVLHRRQGRPRDDAPLLRAHARRQPARPVVPG